MVVAALLALGLMVVAASCGGDGGDAAPTSVDEPKYPPGTTEEMLTETTGDGGSVLEERAEGTGDEEAEPQQQAAATGAVAELAGARFTVVEATREDSNANVLTSGQREVPGDYLEIELEVENVGDDLIDLSEYSFRIWSPGIDAGAYEKYYGKDGSFGGYVSDNIISALLLDYATLQPVAYKLKIGESVDGVFLFFDLNPRNTARNDGVTGEGTNLIFRKSRGEEAGEEVEINLAGYLD